MKVEFIEYLKWYIKSKICILGSILRSKINFLFSFYLNYLCKTGFD